MCFQSMAHPLTSSPIVANTLSPGSGDHYVNYLTSRRTCQLHTTPKRMVRPNESTRSWNSIFKSTLTISRMTGFTSYPLRSSHTTTRHIQPQMSPLSLPTRGSIPISKCPSSLFRQSMLMKWLKISRNCTSTFRPSSSTQSSGTRFTLWTVDCPSRTSKLETLSGWTPGTSRPNAPRRNWTIASQARSQSSKQSPHMQSDSVYPSHSSAYTRFSMSHSFSWNSQVRSPTASTTLHLHWRLTTLTNTRLDESSTAN